MSDLVTKALEDLRSSEEYSELMDLFDQVSSIYHQSLWASGKTPRVQDLKTVNTATITLAVPNDSTAK